MTITVITGANKGLGYETARRLIERGHTVYVGARDAERGKRAAAALGARPLLIDVTDDTSVLAAAEAVRATAGHVDLLVNNAGITGRGAPGNRPAPGGPPVQDEQPAGDGPDRPRAPEAVEQPQPRPEAEADLMRRVYETNVFGAVRTVQAFLPLLSKPGSRVVNVSSGLGSVGLAADPELRSAVRGWAPFPAYASSKAALNMLTILYGQTYPHVDFRAVDPGYTATDLNGHRGFQTVAEGVRTILEVAVGGPVPTTGFVSADGELPW